MHDTKEWPKTVSSEVARKHNEHIRNKNIRIMKLAKYKNFPGQPKS